MALNRGGRKQLRLHPGNRRMFCLHGRPAVDVIERSGSGGGGGAQASLSEDPRQTDMKTIATSWSECFSARRLKEKKWRGEEQEGSLRREFNLLILLIVGRSTGVEDFPAPDFRVVGCLSVPDPPRRQCRRDSRAAVGGGFFLTSCLLLLLLRLRSMRFIYFSGGDSRFRRLRRFCVCLRVAHVFTAVFPDSYRLLRKL
ncbi:hypothetical protein L596_006597 [Steinernema carpocapsae]|uniref:Uncharacterized protein n=1 Tax=Steinernema carpocapsae TaxID=34508 RepID=A0A4U8V2J4_STECR|nr:hypothetical protein L596_006597 [Steinernema carpocapsae]